MYRNSSDCGKSFAFLSVVFLQVRHRGIDLVAVMGACCFANVAEFLTVDSMKKKNHRIAMVLKQLTKLSQLYQI